MSPKVSILLGSSRPGGLDITFPSLAAQTYDSWELIFVDKRYHKRHERVLAYAKECGIADRLIHTPNQRDQPTWGTNCAGVNTGIMLATGEISIILLDYAHCPPEWLEQHVSRHTEPRLVMGPHLYTSLPPMKPLDGGPLPDFSKRPYPDLDKMLAQRERYDEICAFQEPFNVGMLATLSHQRIDPKLNLPEGPAGYWMFHTKNDSFPTEAAIAVNGIDEHYDRGGGPGDPEFGFRLIQYGLQGWICPGATVICLNPREILPNINIWHQEDVPNAAPWEWRWSYDKGYKYMQRSEKEKRARARNPYDMREKRKELQAWRELAKETKPVIPANVTDDKTYWGGEVGPD